MQDDFDLATMIKNCKNDESKKYLRLLFSNPTTVEIVYEFVNLFKYKFF